MYSTDNSTSKLIKEIDELKTRYESLKTSYDLLVEEQRRSQTEFFDSRLSAEKRLSSIFRVAPTGIGVVIKRVISEVNPKLIEITGYSKEELIGQNSRILYISDEEYDYVGKEKYNQIKEKGTGTVETKWFRKDGKIIDILLASTPIDVNDLSKGVTFTVLDITKRKRGEARLKQSEYLLNKAQEIAHVGSWSLDLKTNALTWSDEIYRIFGLDPTESEQTYETFIEAVHPEDRETVDKAYRTSIEEGKDSYEIEHRVVTKNRSEVRYVIERCEHIKDSDGNITCSIGMVQDITDRKRGEEQLRKLSRAVEQSINAVIITDTKGIIEYANPAVWALTGHTSEELIGVNLRSLCCLEEPNNNCEEIWTTLYAGKVWTGEISNYRKNGEHYWESAIFSPIFNEQGEILNFLAIKKDITLDKKMEEELVQAKEKAEESDRLKSAFLANMSHEIRTPMNGIMGFAELLREPDLSTEQMQEYIRIIEKSGQRMLNLVNDITDIARIEAGQMKLSIHESNVNEIVKEAYKFFMPEAESKGISLSFITSMLPEEAVLKTDRDKLFATLSNLIKNSLKFTFSGSIDFGYQKKGEFLEFYVKDTGIGIPEEKQAAVFERFIQADMSNTRISEGTGLGLSISKAYVEMLGGKIWLESEVGKGTCFYFTIPLQN